jgi:hypothetical protein
MVLLLQTSTRALPSPVLDRTRQRNIHLRGRDVSETRH